MVILVYYQVVVDIGYVDCVDCVDYEGYVGYVDVADVLDWQFPGMLQKSTKSATLNNFTSCFSTYKAKSIYIDCNPLDLFLSTKELAMYRSQFHTKSSFKAIFSTLD